MSAREARRPRRSRRGIPDESIIELALADHREATDLAGDLATYHETGTVLTGGDLDADWPGAYASGEEAVGGSAPTPDQDVVDEIGRALGVERADGEELRTSDEILRARDRFRWHLEGEAEDCRQGRAARRRQAAV